ncbi:MAG: hypothetical protein H6704_29790 [Myxococcales bacterium]|nr:hypothetical protein [Myxococcales bacterium]
MNRAALPVPFAGLLVGLGALAAPGVASADLVQIKESPRTTFIEFRMGNYLPGIDDEFDTSARKGPFEEVFGSSPELMFNLMWEQHIWHGFGTLAGGVGIGYWSIDGTGVAVGGADADDSTTMRILPLQAQLSYRFDHFRDSWPLVPVAALGIDYYAWDILGGDDEVTDFDSGQEARGGTWGWHYSVGLHLLLDFFAPEMAFDFDREAGVNSSYLTLEYQGLQVSDFGASDSFRLSDEVFMFGIALEL